MNPDFHGQLYPKTAGEWFNPEAFSAPVAGTFGNASRDGLIGPGLTDVDLSFAKNTTIHERLRTQFRAEYFNILNHTNFTTPKPGYLSSTGPTPASPEPLQKLSPTAGGVATATATTSPAVFNLGWKFLF